MAIQGAMAENLFRLSAIDLSPEPWLATSAERLDPVTWEIGIRDGVKFHNGAVMDVEAVKASLDRTVRLSPGDEERLAIASVEVKDNQTVIVTTTKPRPTLPGLLTNSNTAIVNAAAADAAGEDNFVTAGALTGPYIPTEYIRKERLSSVANDDYWGGVPLLAGIDYIAIPDTNSRELALQAGDIDFAINISPEGVEHFNSLPGLHSRTAGEGASVVMWWVNFERGPLSDPLIRQAVSQAIDTGKASPESLHRRGRVPLPTSCCRKQWRPVLAWTGLVTTHSEPVSCWPRPATRTPTATGTSTRTGKLWR